MASVSIIVPTRNEASHLPTLLSCLKAQTCEPNEIVVADASSIDLTRAIADAAGVKVIDGGTPAEGRNAGAYVSKGDYLLFLDADTCPPQHLIEQFLQTAGHNSVDLVSCLFRPILGGPVLDFIFWAGAKYFLLSNRFGRPRGIGACLLVRRSVHTAIGGFDETIAWGEDLEYVQRANQMGYRFLLLPQALPISPRRFTSLGALRTCLSYVHLEARRKFFGEIRGYDHGYFTKGGPTQ